MDRKALQQQFELELRQAVIDYENGDTVALKDLKWGGPLHVAEATVNNYRATEFWTDVIFTRAATVQVEKMYDYILKNLLNDTAAYHFRHILETKAANISMVPDGGTNLIDILDDISPSFATFQRRIAKRYVVVYKYYKGDNIALVTHIFHQTQDYGKLFQN